MQQPTNKKLTILVYAFVFVLQEKVRMRFKLSFTLGEKSYTEVGEVNEFPPADRWGAL